MGDGNMARILVTGASGFIGYHLVHALIDQGHEISCLARRSSNLDRLAGLPIRRIEGDVVDAGSLAAALAGQEAVYHLAGLVKAVKPAQLYQVNCLGTENIARACARQTPPPLLLLVSSLAAMGPSTPDRPRLECDPAAPVSDYGRSKLAGEHAARRWAAEAPITIVRPPIVFGEADPATCEMFRPIARCGLHVVPSWRTHFASVIHAADLVQAMILAAQCGERIVGEPADGEAAAQGTYFVAAERDPSFPELGRMIGTALGRRRTAVLRLSAPAVWTVGFLATLMSRLRGQAWYFSLDKAREARAGSWTCSAAAIGELGFTVAHPLEDRLRQTADWYRANRWL
jgi:nucleoside-diphosphate-sugar epimerase